MEYNNEINLSVKFNTGLYERMLNLNAVYDNLGEIIASGIMFFNSFSGCDSKTAFSRREKCSLQSMDIGQVTRGEPF